MKNRKKGLLSWLLMALMILGMVPTSAFAAESEEANQSTTIQTVAETQEETVPSATVYFSISHDDEFVVGKGSNTVMALQKVKVPYFDLALYGLADFYFSSESYGDDGDGKPGSDLDSGTAGAAYGKITMLHLFIYATEVYYCGISPSEAGKGYLYKENLMGTDTFNCSGSVGSMFFYNFWGMDLNLNYYLNHQYPLASAGWGATADQILLKDGDVVTLGHFSDWSFFNDPTSVFNFIQVGNDNITTTVTQGETLDLSVMRAGADFSGNYDTTHTAVTSRPTVYYAPADEVASGNVTSWTALGQADADGKLSVDTSKLACGEYVFGLAGQYGSTYTEAICSTPGAIRVTITDKSQALLGDLNGDGAVTAADVALLLSRITSGEEVSLEVGDLNGDGQITTADVAQLLAQVTAG